MVCRGLQVVKRKKGPKAEEDPAEFCRRDDRHRQCKRNRVSGMKLEGSGAKGQRLGPHF